MEHVTPQSARQGLSEVNDLVAISAKRAGRSPQEIKIIAAVKYLDLAASEVLLDAGIVDQAENRLARLEERHQANGPTTTSRICWHFIGRLQSRQAAQIASRVMMIHSLCTLSAARRLDRAWKDSDANSEPIPEVLVQVNVDNDMSKDGLSVEQVEGFLEELPLSVRVSGFMAMPAFTQDAENSRRAFVELRKLRDYLAPRFSGRHDLKWLSMGTSQDFTVAIEEGATHVRLGRILFPSV